ncbi:expressed protein [Phakopsora pachyrhizi]|uniref:Expressed protein n=1 Tax=Phakopsora pachyrhizi TaxID=170000 RepID=A0AAV0AET5_PHAPC|nr:expressed protein [Phakopsora pachyrhizi]
MDQRRKSLFIPKSYSSQTNMRVRLSDLGTKSNENPTVVEIKGDMASEAATPSELMQVLKKSDLTTVEADWSWDNMGNDSVPEGVTDSNVSQDLDHKSRNSVEVETKGEEEMSSEKKELKKPLKLDMNLLEIIVRAVVLNLKLLKTRHIHDETLKNLEKFKRSTLGLHPVHRKIYGAKLEESVLRVSSIQAELDAYLHGLDDEFCDTLVTLVEPHYDTLHSENLTLDSWRPKPVEYIQPSITNLCSSPVKQVFENPRSPVKAADPSDDWSSWGAGPSNTTKGSNPSTFSENATQASQDQISGWGQSDFSSSLGSSKNPNLTPIGGFKGQSSSFNSGGGWSSESSGNNRNDESSTYNSGGWGGGRGGGRGGYRAEGREGGFNRGRGRGSYENSSGSGGGSGWGNSNGFSRGRGYAPRGRAEGHGSGMTSSWGNNSSNSEAVSSFNSGERSSFSGGWGQVDEGLGGGNNSTSGQNSSKTTESNSTWSTGHQDSSKTDGNPTTNSEDYSSAWNSY